MLPQAMASGTGQCHTQGRQYACKLRSKAIIYTLECFALHVRMCAQYYQYCAHAFVAIMCCSARRHACHAHSQQAANAMVIQYHL